MVFLLYWAVQTPFVKDRIAQEGLLALNKEFGTDIQAKKVEIDWKNDLILHQLTAKDHHQYPFLTIEKLKGDINLIELGKYLYNQNWSFKNLTFDKITLIQPKISILTYKDETKDNLSLFIQKFQNDKPPTGEPFIFESDFDLQSGLVSLFDQNTPTDTLWAKDFNLKVDHFNTKGSQIKGQLRELHTILQKGSKSLLIDNLTTDFSYSQTAMNLPNLRLQTPDSELDLELNLNYNTTEDFKNFANRVQWQGELKEGSHLNGKLLNFFINNWDSKSDYYLQSGVSGTLNDLRLTDLSAHSEGAKLQSPLMELKHLSSGDDFYIQSSQLHAVANEQSLLKMLPSTTANKLKNTLSSFGKLDYKGALALNRDDIKAKGVLISTLGVLDFDATLNQYSSKKPIYRGTLSTQNVSLTPLVQSPAIRNVNGNFTFQGSGFSLDNADLKLEAQLQSMDLDQFEFRRLDADLHIAQKIIEGVIQSEDPQNELMAEGVLNLQQEQIIAQLEGQVKNLVLNQYTKLNSTTSIQGNFKVEAQASSLNDLEGKMHFENVIYNSPEKAMAFSSIDIDTYLENHDRILHIFAPQNVRGKLKGRFNLEDIPYMFENGISNLVVGMVPRKNLKNKFLFIDMDIEDNIVDLFIPKLDLQNGSNILGTYDGSTNDLILNVSAPRLSYDKLLADSVEVIINTDNPSQQLRVDVGGLSYETYALQNFHASGFVKNDTLRLQNVFNINGKNGQKVHLNLFQTNSPEDLFIGIENSNFEVNSVVWNIESKDESGENLIRYHKKDGTLYLNQLSVFSDLAEINATAYYKNEEDFLLVASANDVLLENIVPKNALGEYTLKGLINGELEISQKGHILEPLAHINVQDLYFNTYYLGELNSDMTLDNSQQNSYRVNLNLNKNEHQYFDVKGSVFNEKDQAARLDLKADLDKFEMNILNELLSGVFQNIRGTTSGQIQIEGPVKDPGYNGYLSTQDLGLTIDYLNTDYLFENDSEILLQGSFSNGLMYFDNIGFIDTQENTSGNLYGAINNINLSVWGLNLSFQSVDEKGIMILDTTADDNDLFYGKVFATGEFNLYGSTNEQISVYSDAKVLKNSDFTLNNATSYNVENTSIIEYPDANPIAQSNSEELPSSTLKNDSGINLNFSIAVEDGAHINVLLDQLTNSIINVEGESDNITFKLSDKGEIEMDGIYDVSRGTYNFKLGPFTKRFNIDDNSRIIFSGDPYNALLDIHAHNEIVVNNIGQYLNIQSTPNTDVDLGIDLSGTLKEMKIDYAIETPKASSEIQNQLDNKFFNNPDEKNFQFIYLLTSKRFNTDQSNFISSAGISNAYDIAISQLIGWLNSIDPNVQLGATYLPEDNATNTSSFLQATLNLRLSNRWKITTVQGIPISTANATNNAIWTSEVEVEYDVSKNNDQSVVLEGFTRPTTFGVQNFSSNSSTYQTYGFGVILRWEFDKFREVFNKNKNPKPQEEKPAILQDSVAIIEKEVKELMNNQHLID